MASEVWFVLSSFSNVWDIEPTISSYKEYPKFSPHFLSPLYPSSTLSTLPLPAPHILKNDKPDV